MTSVQGQPSWLPGRPLQLEVGDVICHRHWRALARIEGSGHVFLCELVRTAWAQENDLLGDWRNDMASWVSWQRPLCEHLPPEDVARAFRMAVKKKPEVKGRTKRAEVPKVSIDRTADQFVD